MAMVDVVFLAAYRRLMAQVGRLGSKVLYFSIKTRFNICFIFLTLLFSKTLDSQRENTGNLRTHLHIYIQKLKNQCCP